jgi:predicted lipid-binding transport protein (Tim44 family)
MIRLTKKEKQARAAGIKLAAALCAIEQYDGDPAEVLEEARHMLTVLPVPAGKGALDTLAALWKHFDGEEL